MSADRSTGDVVRQCIIPDVRITRDYLVESVDGVDEAPCCLVEVEWLSLYFQIAFGRFRPGERYAAAPAGAAET